jgi:rubrerythrin
LEIHKLLHKERQAIEKMPEKTLQVMFELAINWETQARDLYVNFTGLFRDEPKVSAFWRQLSQDESDHIYVLKNILNKIPAEKLLAELNNEQWNAVIRVEGLMKEASTRKVKTLNDAYEVAHELETSEINTLFKMVVNDCLPDDKGHAFIADVTEHIAKLISFGDEYTLSERRHINIHDAS